MVCSECCLGVLLFRSTDVEYHEEIPSHPSQRRLLGAGLKPSDSGSLFLSDHHEHWSCSLAVRLISVVLFLGFSLVKKGILRNFI